MHYKRHRIKNRRAGCLECKPWKAVGVADRGRPSDQRKAEGARQELAALRGMPNRAGDGRPRASASTPNARNGRHQAKRRAAAARVARSQERSTPGRDLDVFTFRCWFGVRDR